MIEQGASAAIKKRKIKILCILLIILQRSNMDNKLIPCLVQTFKIYIRDNNFILLLTRCCKMMIMKSFSNPITLPFQSFSSEIYNHNSTLQYFRKRQRKRKLRLYPKMMLTHFLGSHKKRMKRNTHSYLMNKQRMRNTVLKTFLKITYLLTKHLCSK